MAAMLGISSKLVNVILAVFVAGWAISLVAEIFTHTGYKSPTGLNETMIAVITAFVVANQRQRLMDTVHPHPHGNGNGGNGGTP